MNGRDYLLICMLPLFCAKLANSIFVDLLNYKNLMVPKNKILGVMDEPEETGSMETFKQLHMRFSLESWFPICPQRACFHWNTFTLTVRWRSWPHCRVGSGKSTILNLIAKYYEAGGGTISIGGKPIDHVAAERVLEQISWWIGMYFCLMIPIRESHRHTVPWRYGRWNRDGLPEANCSGFIRKMEKGYDTPTGENGNLLSGGERQRISIARAILKNSPILLPGWSNGVLLILKMSWL